MKKKSKNKAKKPRTEVGNVCKKYPCLKNVAFQYCCSIVFWQRLPATAPFKRNSKGSLIGVDVSTEQISWRIFSFLPGLCSNIFLLRKSGNTRCGNNADISIKPVWRKDMWQWSDGFSSEATGEKQGSRSSHIWNYRFFALSCFSFVNWIFPKCHKSTKFGDSLCSLSYRREGAQKDSTAPLPQACSNPGMMRQNLDEMLLQHPITWK